MKLIFFGATGYIGGNVLTSALADPRITQVLVVSRRPIPRLEGEGKATIIILKDFATYPDDVVKVLGEADACIWCMGTYDGDEEVEIVYPKRFFEVMVGSGVWKARKQGFEFVYLGGAFTETDQEPGLWFYQTARRVRGRAQTTVVGWEGDERGKGLWRSVVVRPAAVMNLAEGRTWARWLAGRVFGDGLCVGIAEVAGVMIEIAVGGVSVEKGKRGRLVENREVVRKGGELLALKKGGVGSG